MTRAGSALMLLLLAGCDSGGPESDASLPDGSLDGDLPDGDAAPSEGLVGHPCTSDEDCIIVASAGRVVCLRRSWGFRDGYCTILGASGPVECETADPNAVHVDLSCASDVCMARCVGPTDCREGYECQPTLAACWPRCEPGRACPLQPPAVCQFDEDCDDQDPCTADGCVDGICAYDRVAEQARRVARMATVGAAVDVDLTGSLAEGSLRLLVAEGEDGVEAIDLTNPSAPALAFNLETAGPAVAVVRHGNRIAVAEDLSGLQLFPAGGGSAVSPPAGFDIDGNGTIDVAEGAGSAAGLSEQNRFLYAYRHGAYQLDVDGATLSGAVCDTRGRAVDGLWYGGTGILLVADSLAGLAVCDWSGGTSPMQIERLDTLGRLLSIDERDRVLVAAEAGAGVGIFDVFDQRAPKRMETTAPLDGEAVEVRMTGRRTFFAAASEGGVYAFALEDCYVPQLWYRWETEGPALAIDEQDGVLAVAMGEGGVDLLDLGCRESETEE